MTRLISQNTKVTLSDRIAAPCLALALRQAPDVWFGQEWGPNRNDVMADHGTMQVWGRGRKVTRRAKADGMLFVRPAEGGEPVGLSDRWHVVDVQRVILAHGRHVLPQDGARAIVGDNDATLVEALDLVKGGTRKFLNVHFEAHVQKGDHNAFQAPKDPRAQMHREERAAAVATHADVIAGDTNWHHLRLPGYVSCWDGRSPQGTLGNRAIDAVFARKPAPPAKRVRLLGTPAREHKLVVVDWPVL